MARITERFIEAMGGITAAHLQEATQAAANRAYEAGFYDGGNDDPASGDIKAGRQGYKRIADKFVREGKIDYDKALETAWTLWQKSPLAKRVLGIKRDHIIGHNAEPSCDDDDVGEIVKAFWKGNKLGKRSSEFTIQLFGFGEQCFPAFVREADGRVRLGYIDPARISKVIKHPENTLEDMAVIVGKSHTEYRAYRIIREEDPGLNDAGEVLAAEYEGKLVTWEQAAVEPWEMEMLKDHGRAQYDGSCFYAKVNAVSNQSRGMSDLLQVADWIDQGDQVLFALADREQFAGYFAFDVTLTGADKAKVMERSKEIAAAPPRKGSVNVHNDSEEWMQWAPDLGQPGSIETFRAILGLILGGMGFPVHWYGFGDDANRATAVAQGDPTAKSLEHDQGVIQDLFLTMCQFAVDQAEIAGALAEPEEYEVMLDLPEVTTKDMSRITASMSGLAQALTQAQEQGWLSQETAVRTWAKIMGELDIEVDPAAEMEAVEKEQAEREREQQQQQANALTQLMAQQNGQPMANGQQQPMMNGQPNGRAMPGEETA